MIDLLLETRVREGETEGERFGELDDAVLVRKVIADKVVEALGAEVEQLLSVLLLLVLGTGDVDRRQASATPHRARRCALTGGTWFE